MPLPQDLDQAIEKLLANVPKNTLMAAATDLTNRYRSPNRDQLQNFMLSDLHRFAYLAVRMPATFAAIKRVLEECKKRMPDFNPKSVLDVGAGPGTASWAASDVFPEISFCSLLEKDRTWLQLGKRLMENSEHEALRKAVWSEADLEKSPDNDHGNHDLVILSYVIGELSQEAITKLIDAAYQVSQILVLIEPGTPHGFERIRTARSHLIAKGAYLVAPCPHHGPCPMANGDWCHFTERLERSSLHMHVKDVSLGYEDEKYSYLIASKTPCKLPNARILRHPQHHSGHIEFILCTPHGLEKKTLSRKHKDVYKKARKLEWGDTLEM